MTGKYLKKGLAAFAVIVLALSPAFGALCAMPCGAGGENAGASCCCRPSETLAAEVIANPSCCTSEVKTADPAILVRATASSDAVELTPVAVCTTEKTQDIAGVQSPTPRALSPGNARSSPLFLLHASFII